MSIDAFMWQQLYAIGLRSLSVLLQIYSCKARIHSINFIFCTNTIGQNEKSEILLITFDIYWDTLSSRHTSSSSSVSCSRNSVSIELIDQVMFSLLHPHLGMLWYGFTPWLHSLSCFRWQASYTDRTKRLVLSLKWYRGWWKQGLNPVVSDIFIQKRYHCVQCPDLPKSTYFSLLFWWADLPCMQGKPLKKYNDMFKKPPWAKTCQQSGNQNRFIHSQQKRN